MQNKDKVPVIDTEKCTNCDKCISVCPNNAIYKNINYSCSKCIKYCLSLEVPCNQDQYSICYDKCNACGLCVLTCNINSINWHIISLELL